ncbi:MAG: hypothetical protein JXA46_16935 [Dehalococcoidales bacterium]|nr:hypothetical protein [Dehalococcoidales bacterium]
MLRKMLDSLPSLICRVFGHQYTRRVFSGKVAQVYDPSIKASIPKPVMEIQPVEYCLRCGKPARRLRFGSNQKQANPEK